jgi:hypothetical protein
MKPDMKMAYGPLFCKTCGEEKPRHWKHASGCPIAYLESLGPLHDEWLRTYTHCRDEGSIGEHIAAEIALAFHLVETP